MAETLRSDGKAVDVTVNATITKGDAVSQDGFQGIAMQDAVSGETIALEIAQREHEIVLEKPANPFVDHGENNFEA